MKALNDRWCCAAGCSRKTRAWRPGGSGSGQRLVGLVRSACQRFSALLADIEKLVLVGNPDGVAHRARLERTPCARRNFVEKAHEITVRGQAGFVEVEVGVADGLDLRG